jgi:hypothetical protein
VHPQSLHHGSITGTDNFPGRIRLDVQYPVVVSPVFHHPFDHYQFHSIRSALRAAAGRPTSTIRQKAAECTRNVAKLRTLSKIQGLLHQETSPETSVSPTNHQCNIQ